MKRFIDSLLFFLFCIGFSSAYCQDFQNLSNAIVYHKDQENRIGYLQLTKDAPIQESTYLYVKFALEEFRKQKVAFVLLDLDSPGGEVFAALKISQALKQLDSQFHIPVIAFIDNWALSAGALLAYSCRFIGITTDASMGAAEPVIASSDGKMESASEKMNSALRAEFANTARFFGRDPLIAEAMVDKDIILVKRKGSIIRLESENDLILSGKSPDQIISRKGKLLTLDSKDMIDLGVADFQVPYQSIDPITAEEKAEGRWPFAKNLISNQPFLHSIPQATLIDYQNNKITFFTFLSHPLVSSVLILGLIIGVYGEMSHPGFGFFGITALICLSLIALSTFAIHTIAWLELIAIGVGIILLTIELLVLPGFGWAGFTGIIFLFIGLSTMFLPNIAGTSSSFFEWSLATDEMLYRLSYFIGSIVICFVMLIFISRFLLKKNLFASHLILKGEMDRDKGFLPAGSDKSLPDVSSKGLAYTPLRPFGKVMIEGALINAQAQSGFIEKGTPIIVCHLEDQKVFVKIDK